MATDSAEEVPTSDPPITAPATAKDRRIPSLDGLRAVSISLVIAWHIALRVDLPLFRNLWRIDAGNLGVRVFFVISGYLITTLLLVEHERSGAISLPHFYYRRTLRIAPALLAFLIGMGIVAGLGLLPSGLRVRDLLVAGTYTANYLPTSPLVAHTWSLAVEEQFYLLWPGLLVFLGVQRGFRVALAMLFIAPVLRTLALHSSVWPDNPRYAFECVADALATGCLLSRFRTMLWANARYRRLLCSREFRCWPVAVALIAFGTVRWPTVGAVVGISLLNISVGMGIDWSLRFPETFPARFLNFAPVVYVGTLSYSLYLWQQPFLSTHLRWPLPVSLLALALTALASFYLVEKPALRMRSRYERRIFG